MRRRWMLAIPIVLSLGTATAAGQTAPGHSRLDAILDIYVRDGRVYYRALRLERSSLDRYVASLDVAVDALPRDDQAAFWLNAYNALVLRTVVDRYPIRGAAPQYPPGSIRQIPGAFDGRRFSVGGRNVTLDEIEALLTEFGDPRLLLALGRGALGSPRLRSEAFRSSTLEQQLQAVVTDFVASERQVNVDRSDGRLRVSPILGWQAVHFIAAYADEGAAAGARSPVERATLALIGPHLLPREREFIAADAFVMEYLDFDWRLNDLTGF